MVEEIKEGFQREPIRGEGRERKKGRERERGKGGRDPFKKRGFLS